MELDSITPPSINGVTSLINKHKTLVYNLSKLDVRGFL